MGTSNATPRQVVAGWKRLLCGAAAAALLAGAAQAGPVVDRIKQRGKIVLALRESSVPFSYLHNGKPVGYAVELCLKIAAAVSERLGIASLAVDYLTVTPATRIDTIVQGKADLECGSTTNNAERREKVAFTVPHYITGPRYMVPADSPVSELPQFEGKRLASTRGTTVLEALKKANAERLLRIDVVEVDDHAAAVEMVERGEAAGFAMDDVLLYGLIASRPKPQKLKVVGKFLAIEPLAIMLSKDDGYFKEIVDDAMKKLVRSREAHALYERWFMKPIPPHHRALGLPMHYLLKEEWNHFHFFSKAAAAMGLSPDAVRDSSPLPMTMEMSDFMRQAARTDMLCYAVCSAVLEGTTTDGRAFNPFYEAVQERYGVPEAAVKPIYDHLELDAKYQHANLFKEICEHEGSLSAARAARVLDFGHQMVEHIWLWTDNIEQYYGQPANRVPRPRFDAYLD
jgi:ABC-type amino acid transport substrate-binding protein